MDGTIALNNPTSVSLPKIKTTKKKVMNQIKSKLEAAKLNLIYTELESEGIPFDRTATTVKELTKSLKKYLNNLDYNKVKNIVEKVNTQLNEMVGSLEKGSTSAFTKLMTSDLAKTIAKTVGISLAGRTALVLAPTIGTKAIVATGLAGYGLYRIVKNRKEIIKANENTELNNILMELETKKENGKYTETRFNEKTQEVIREFLKSINITFEDTGYRSLRQTIYSLNSEQKKSLCNHLNNVLGKGIEVDKRVEKARKKLNVLSSTAATVSAGSAFGIRLANTVNGIDPGALSGILNGTVLGAWVNAQTEKKWFTALASGLGLIGTEVIEHLPVIGGIAEKVFAVENLATLGTLGAAGGLIVGSGLALASAGKRIFNIAKSKKETEAFLKLDAQKYSEEDKKEMEIISEKLKEPSNTLEIVIIDIVLGYLKDENIKLESTPKSIDELKQQIEKLTGEDKRKASEIINRIHDNMNNNPEFVNKLKKAGKISIGLFTAGLAAMSVYDIIKGGTFLPEVSQKLFPANNIHAPVEVPPALDEKLNPTNDQDASIITSNKAKLDEFNNNPEYMIERTPESTIEYGYNYGVQNPGIAGYSAEQYIVDEGLSENAMPWLVKFLDWLGEKFGAEKQPDLIPNIPAISEKLNELSPKNLYEFYRYFNSVPNDGSPMYEAVREVLGYNNFLEKASNYINGFQKTQELHNLINDLTNKIATGVIPLATALEMLGFAQKRNSNDDYAIEGISHKTK